MFRLIFGANKRNQAYPIFIRVCRYLHVYKNFEEKDLVEKFVRGTGPGGQSINKTKSCVQLVHVPTGLTVHCQEQRCVYIFYR